MTCRPTQLLASKSRRCEATWTCPFLLEDNAQAPWTPEYDEASAGPEQRWTPPRKLWPLRLPRRPCQVTERQASASTPTQTRPRQACQPYPAPAPELPQQQQHTPAPPMPGSSGAGASPLAEAAAPTSGAARQPAPRKAAEVGLAGQRSAAAHEQMKRPPHRHPVAVRDARRGPPAWLRVSGGGPASAFFPARRASDDGRTSPQGAHATTAPDAVRCS